MQKTCLNPWCKQSFEITEADLAFYDKISPVFSGKKEQIPSPTLCPNCRMQRRLSFRNERSLYKRACSISGREIVSVYRPDAPFPVYDNPEWWSDAWDGRSYGCDFVGTKPFSQQFIDLLNAVPKMARIQQGENLNAEFTNCASYNKNCYMLFSANGNEDCYYGSFINKCRSCVDNHNILRCELCAHCSDCTGCYHGIGLQDCSNCTDCIFSAHCVGCRSCFGCVNLREKEYHFFNVPCSKEEYASKLEDLRLSGASSFAAQQSKALASMLRHPRRYYEGLQNEDATGNYITQSKHAHHCFDSSDLEDCAFCSCCHNMRDAYDITHYGISETNELLLEGEGIGHGAVRVQFCKLVWGGSTDMLYSYECFACSHCFGCTGLKRASFCILNKQYMEEQYYQLVPQIISRMRQDGEWGEFFSTPVSPFAHNETVAIDYEPITRAEALVRGFFWHDAVDELSHVSKTIPAEKLPESIEEIPDDILNWAIQCEATKRPFKIIKQELEFYRTLGLPVPRLHPDERHRRRMSLRNPRTLWKRTCAKCKKGIETTYAPERPEIVYCESCYLAEVY